MPEEGCLLHDSFGILDEVDDIVYLVTHRYLVFNLLQGILHAEVSLVYQTVGIYDMAQYTFAHLVFVLKHSSVDTVVFCRMYCDVVKEPPRSLHGMQRGFRT